LSYHALFFNIYKIQQNHQTKRPSASRLIMALHRITLFGVFLGVFAEHKQKILWLSQINRMSF